MIGARELEQRTYTNSQSWKNITEAHYKNSERVHAFFFSANGAVYGNEITVTSVLNDKRSIDVTSCRSTQSKIFSFMYTALVCPEPPQVILEEK